MGAQRQPRKTDHLEMPQIAIPGGADSSTKWLIGAVLAAGKDGCECDSCKLLKKFGGAMSEALLKEGVEGGD